VDLPGVLGVSGGILNRVTTELNLWTFFLELRTQKHNFEESLFEHRKETQKLDLRLKKFSTSNSNISLADYVFNLKLITIK
jgi:hypothetical protein